MVVLIVLGVVALFVVATLARTIRVIPQARAGVVERFGRYSRTLNPGLAMVVPFVDRIRRTVDLREQVVSFPPQPVITQDNVVVNVETVIYFQITDAKAATYEIANSLEAIDLLSVTTLRNVIGAMTLDQTLTSRDSVNDQLRGILDEATGKWGIRIHRVELKAIDPPATIKDTMEKQIRAEREKRAAILQAEGIKQAAILHGGGRQAVGDPEGGGPEAGGDPLGRGSGAGDRHRLPGDPRRRSRPEAARLPVPAGAAADRAGRREQGVGDPERAHARSRWGRGSNSAAASERVSTGPTHVSSCFE